MSVNIKLCISCMGLQLKRRGWDLNPRTTYMISGFQDRCNQPLCDLSISRQSDLNQQSADYKSAALLLSYFGRADFTVYSFAILSQHAISL